MCSVGKLYASGGQFLTSVWQRPMRSHRTLGASRPKRPDLLARLRPGQTGLAAVRERIRVRKALLDRIRVRKALLDRLAEEECLSKGVNLAG
jgi:hypothetical protein